MGFQILEDITYIIPKVMKYNLLEDIIPTTFQRIASSIASHWIYSAIVLVGIYMVYHSKKDLKGYFYIIIPVVLHFIWNSPMVNMYSYSPLIYSILSTITIIIFLKILNIVLKQNNINTFDCFYE